MNGKYTFGLALLPVAVAFASYPAFVNAAEDNATQLTNVVVSAAGYEQKLVEAPASISVITAKDLMEKRYNNLAQALNDVEGLDVESTNGKTGGWNIRIRGMDSAYTLVLIDGKRQNTTSSTAPNGFGETATSFMPPLAAIERIEIIRGPASTLYGSDAMGGAINIITKKTSGEWHGSLNLDKTIQTDFDFGDSSNANVYAAGPIVEDLLGLQLRGSVFSRNPATMEYEDGVPVNKRGPSPVKSVVQTAGARLVLTPSKSHDLVFDVDQAKQKYDNKDGQLGTVGAAGGYDDRLQFNRDQIYLAHTGRYGFGTWDTSITQTSTEKVGRLIPTSTGYPNAGGDREIENTNIVVDTKLVSRFEALGRHTTNIGGQYIDAKMKDGVATEKFNQDTASLFIEDEWAFIDGLALTLGARYDEHSAFGGHVSPRAYLVWNTTDRLTLKGGVSTGYKTPTLEQLHDGLVNLGGQGKTAVIGSPDLKPETSTSTEIAAYFDTLTGVKLNATIFYNQFKDKIASGDPIVNCEFNYTDYLATNPSSPIPDPGAIDPNSCYSLGAGKFTTQYQFSQSVNVDKALTKGFEFGSDIELLDNLVLRANYTYTDSEAQDETGKVTGKLTDTPEHMANTSIRWLYDDKLTTWIKAEYRGERRRYLKDAKDLTGNDKLAYEAAGNYKAYTLFSLGGSYAYNDNVTINASIDNLFDKDFLTRTEYVNGSGATAYVQDYNLLLEPRRIWMGVNVAF